MTEEKSLERLLEDQAMPESGQELEELLEHFADLIYVVDTEGSILYESSSVSEILDREPLESGESNMEDVVHPDDVEDVLDELEELNDREEDTAFRYRVKSADGSWKHLETKTLNRFSSDFDGFIAVSRDVTSQVKEANNYRFLTQLMTHDIGNYLTTSIGYLELVQDEDVTEKQKQNIETVEKALDGIKTVIESSRSVIDAGKANREPVEIRSTIKESIDTYNEHAQKEGMIIIDDTDQDLDEVYAGELIDQVFSNLYENAIEHSKGSVIRVSYDSDGDYTRITVEDDGKGLPERLDDELFSKASKGIESSGMGLGTYIANYIVEEYGGAIEHQESDLGGARFDIYLENTEE